MPTDKPTAPEQDQRIDAVDAESPSQEVSAHEADGDRIAEAGHGYVGRQMDDRLKTTPRVEGSGEAGDDAENPPGGRGGSAS